MKIKFGAIVTDGRGKIGGHVASKNRGGAYLRTKVTPTNPNTTAQAQARSLLGSLSQAWRDLTAEQRLAWNGAVSEWSKTDIFGDIKNPTGLNLYIKVNANLSSVGAGLLTVPAPKEATPTAFPVSAVYSIATNDITFTMSDSSGATIDALVRATPSLSQGVSFVKSELRVIGSYTGTGTTLVASAYDAKYGTPTLGDNVVASVQYVLSNGQKTVPVQVKVTVSA